jgi:hypothetical protein
LQTPSAPWVLSLAPLLGPSAASNRWLWASTSVFARHWHSLTRDSYIRVLSAKSCWHMQVSGFGGCLWDGSLDGAVSGWSFLPSPSYASASQIQKSSIGWNTGTPIKELQKVPKELKGSTAL